MTYEEVIAYFGSAGEAAKALEVNDFCPRLWKSRQKVPLRIQKKIEEMSGGDLIADSRQKPTTRPQIMLHMPGLGAARVTSINISENKMRVTCLHPTSGKPVTIMI